MYRPSSQLLIRMKKMLDNTPIIRNWRFCDQDLLTVFFGGGGEKPQDWGIEKEELGDLWMGLPYYYNALIPMRYVYATRLSPSFVSSILDIDGFDP